MATCSHSATCALYPLFTMQALLNIWRITYCESDKHTQCARFLKSCAGESVPLNLLPNGKLFNTPQGDK